MTSFYRFTALAFVLTAFGAPACAVDSNGADDDDADSADDALSASRIQSLGPIAAGETKTFGYTTTPKYRAFTFTGKATDTVTLHATADSGSLVRLWVLGDASQTLAYNSTKTAGDLTYKFKKSGAYSFAIATIDSTSATVTFDAEIKSVPQPVDAPPIAACVGNITPVEAQAAYSAGHWLSLRYHAFTRNCNESPAKSCTPWQQDDTLPVQGTAINGARDSVMAFDAQLVAQASGISIMTNAIGATYSPVVTSGSTSTTTIDITSSYTDSSGWCEWDHHTYCGYPYTVTTNYAKMSGVVTESCAHLSSGVFQSNVADFGGGVISYVETTSYWTND